MGPTLSELQQRAIQPVLATLPKVGRKPVAPHRIDGSTMEPKVSVPIANATRPAAVAAADPAEDPPEPEFKSQGLRVRPPNQISSIASSPRDNLATSTAPAFSSCLATKQ